MPRKAGSMAMRRWLRRARVRFERVLRSPTALQRALRQQQKAERVQW